MPNHPSTPDIAKTPPAMPNPHQNQPPSAFISGSHLHIPPRSPRDIDKTAPLMPNSDNSLNRAVYATPPYRTTRLYAPARNHK